jgi:DNA-binding transcriptional regulator YbjK
MIAEHGVAGTTHRHVAARADVPLGSITYHFSSLADLRARAFARYVDQQNEKFEALFGGVRTREGLVEILVDLVHGAQDRHRSAVLGFELHLAALRDAGLRTLTHAWTEESRRVLARFVDPEAAARLDALLEGMILHALLATTPEPRETTRATIEQALGATFRPPRS